jgi:MFS transporter, FSR family, fosmidomycin resistance protein
VSFVNAMAGKTRIAAQRWRALATACLAHVLHDGYADMLYLLFPFWQRELSLSFAQVGLLKTLYSGSMAAAQVPAGRLGERRGERLALVVGTILTAGAVLAFHWATTPLVLGLLLVLGGLGASVQHPLASSLVAKSYDGPALRTVLGTYNFAGDLGKVAIPGALALLIAQFGWQAGTQAVGALGLGVAVILFVALAPQTRGRASEPAKATVQRRHLPERARRRAFTALSAIGVLDSATRTGFLTFLPFVLARKGASTAEVGAALSLVFAGGAAGKFACGVLATRLGVLRTVVLTELGTAVGIVLLLILPVWYCLALMPVVGVALNGTSSVIYGSVPELAPSGRQARAFGLFYTLTIGAGAIAPPLFGIVGDLLNLASAMLLVAAIVLLILPLVFFLRPVFRNDSLHTEGSSLGTPR